MVEEEKNNWWFYGGKPGGIAEGGGADLWKAADLYFGSLKSVITEIHNAASDPRALEREVRNFYADKDNRVLAEWEKLCQEIREGIYVPKGDYNKLAPAPRGWKEGVEFDIEKRVLEFSEWAKFEWSVGTTKRKAA